MSGWQIKESQEGEVHSEREKNDQAVCPAQKPLFFTCYGTCVDICYQGRLFPIVPDPHSERLFIRYVGDSAHFKANREAIEL